MTTCKKCKKLGNQCENCKNYEVNYRQTHREKFREYNAKYYANHKEEIRHKDRLKYSLDKEGYKLRARKREIKRIYGLDHEVLLEMISGQDEKCAICRVSFNNGKLGQACIDHDHKTGKVRGILCRGCNLILGHIEKNNNFLTLAKQYLNKLVK